MNFETKYRKEALELWNKSKETEQQLLIQDLTETRVRILSLLSKIRSFIQHVYPHNNAPS